MIKNEIIAAELQKQGLSANLSKFIHVENEADLPGAVSELKGFIPTTIEEVRKHDTLSKLFQTETDRRVTDAIKTHDEKLKDLYDLVEKGKKPDSKKPEDKTEPSPLEQRLESLEKALLTIAQSSQAGVKKDNILKLLKEKELKGNHDKYLTILTDVPDDELAARVDSLKEAEQALYQSHVDELVKSGAFIPPSPRGKGNASSIGERAKARAERMNPEKNPGKIQYI